MPDLFHGDSVPLNTPGGFKTMDWVQNHLPKQAEPITDVILNETRERLACERIAGVGYCFGARYVGRYLGNGKLDASGFTAHPGMLD
ncbi:uncharacterized protein ACLA_061400 [Aspergillus clavatus NRRL 1]|uniref:Dienelactone hydrolase domain-containing protein n=1 Tax=Aspergillus clavatus (strain ATCC 1007 / CBS 513.65 / DSM 816 / NCTC 3887 / NRRL 1 / QM 1276 / 107) TaxID=344612 RepID=A1CCC1_ASPCL|nr:uncharacterized protein ACLA_061400 [Aspergillus clavatus NRRL 1]EAW12178.1 hypothetical protein ACLA_061400 [Aspergillus clavatus NRRL 1]